MYERFTNKEMSEYDLWRIQIVKVPEATHQS